jgi:aminoglycoside phosphotransferase (APT) family kinase protein
VDWRAIGLAGLGRPEGFLARQVARWGERYERVQTGDDPARRALARWLAERIPPSPPPALLHNDFKLDNVVLDIRDPGRVVAVLDWELATVGDPLVDLGVLLAHWAEPGEPGIRSELVGGATAHAGFMTRAELVARYAARTGRAAGAIRFYEAFALYRVSIIEQQLYHRFHTGETDEVGFATFGDRARRLAEAALEVAEGAASRP